MIIKAKCCVRRYYQVGQLDYDPYALYAPVVSYEAIQILLVLAASKNHLFEGGDIFNACIYKTIEYQVFTIQTTNSTGFKAVPAHVCL